MSKEVAIWKGPQHVVVDEFEYFLLLGVLLEAGILDVGVDHHKILLSLALKSGGLVLPIGGHVFEEQPPYLTAVIYLFLYILWGTPFQACCLSFSRSTMLALRRRS